MHFCLGLASHATIIDKGQIVCSATIEELKATTIYASDTSFCALRLNPNSRRLSS